MCWRLAGTEHAAGIWVAVGGGARGSQLPASFPAVSDLRTSPDGLPYGPVCPSPPLLRGCGAKASALGLRSGNVCKTVKAVLARGSFKGIQKDGRQCARGALGGRGSLLPSSKPL